MANPIIGRPDAFTRHSDPRSRPTASPRARATTRTSSRATPRTSSPPAPAR
ncbi:hypothetical protein [Tessaracoccus coleopterorum]|uniref:hypothetical protein n=1 Tax=Tessaracoccus coleopterorum TaxID=2714950 RepID=UPI001E33D2DF|nr:hypothetical protein [Tessaracoccus coleopterorum]